MVTEAATDPTVGEQADVFRDLRASDPVRFRLVTAALAGIAAYGYVDCTVAQIVARAKVSRRAFYEHFRDREDCLLACYELATDALMARMTRARRRVEHWPERPLTGLTCYLESVTADPGLGRAFTIEILRAGPTADERRMAVHHRWARWMSQESRLDLALPGPPGVRRRELTEAQALAVLAGQYELLTDALLGALDLADPAVLAGLHRRMAEVELSMVTSVVPADLSLWVTTRSE